MAEFSRDAETRHRRIESNHRDDVVGGSCRKEVAQADAKKWGPESEGERESTLRRA